MNTQLQRAAVTLSPLVIAGNAYLMNFDISNAIIVILVTFSSGDTCNGIAPVLRLIDYVATP